MLSTKNLLVFNTQSFGDCLLSTHIATIMHKHYPEWNIHFAFRNDLTLTTAETNKEATLDMLNILGKQPYVKSVGLIKDGFYYGPIEIQFDAVIQIHGWSSELGLVRSQLKPVYDLFNIPGPIDTETKFWGGSLTWKDHNVIRIGLAGYLDFARKWKNHKEVEKLIKYFESIKNIKLLRFGVDSRPDKSYWEQIEELRTCSVLISPMGSLVHMAAGLGIDTISLTSVFPSEYDSPEFYHSGYHKSIKVDVQSNLHCGNFKCVRYKPEDNQQSWGNPTILYNDFWVENCDFTNNKKSCVYNTTADLIINEFEKWLNDRNNRI